MATATRVAATTREVHVQHERLARYIHGHFRRKLTVEDARDCAAEALAEADHAVRHGTEIDDLQRWLRRAAWHNALDAVRKIEGEAQTPRPRHVDLGEHTDRLQDPVRFDCDVEDQHARRADAQTVGRLWQRLSCEEQRALRLRHHDELEVSQILTLMGCSRHHYENLTKRALRKLREALISDTPHPVCRKSRANLLAAERGMPLESQQLAARDLHLDGCLSCRAFDRRRRRLMGTLPLPGLGLADRVLARVHGRFSTGGRLSEHAETVAGTAAVASAGTATATATGSGSLLGAVGLVKGAVAVCSAGALTAGLCVQIPQIATHTPPKPQTERAAATSKSAGGAARLAAVRVATAATAARTSTTATAVTSTTTSARRSTTTRATKSSGESPFTIESAATPVLAKPRPRQPAQARAATLRSVGEPAAATSTAPQPTAPTPVAPTTTQTTTVKPGSFSEEFSP